MIQLICLIFAVNVLSVSESSVSFEKKCPIFLELYSRLIQHHILLSLLFIYSKKIFFVNCNSGVVLQKLHSAELWKALAVLCMFLLQEFLISLWCIVTDLSLSSNFWKDHDLPLCAIFNALSCMRFILLLRIRLWHIQTKG